MIVPPSSEAELLSRARALAGRTLGELAAQQHLTLPDLRRAKGFVGMLLETLLGATAGSKAQRDFPGLGVELKTLPVDLRGQPSESTFVCTLAAVGGLSSWERSWVRLKLLRVLWVPIVQADEPAQRRVGSAFLWTPNPEEDALLAADWEELGAILASGEDWLLTGRVGRALQVRPKGASAAEMGWSTSADGDDVQTMRRGFYLRPSFTASVLARALRVG